MAALALLVGVAVFVLSGVWFVVAAETERRGEIQQLREELGRLQQNLETTKDWTATKTTLPAEVLEQVYFAREVSQVNRAQLQERLKSLAAQSGIQLTQVADLPDGTEDSIVWIGLRISATGRYENMVQFVFAIEQSSPALFITSARLTGDPDPIRATTTEARLDSLMEVRAAIAPSTPVAPEG